MAASPDHVGSSRPGPAIYLHIGEPKTGTTYLQQLMFANRDVLHRQGVVIPGPRPRYHYRAVQDLRGVVPEPDDPLAPFDGAWDRVAAEALQTSRVGIISHEMLASVTAVQADRAVGSFPGADVHVVLTVRDLGSLLPAEWQESVKNRTVRSYEDWLSDVIDHESIQPDRRRWGFWSVHDTVEILSIWSRRLPPENVHVITVSSRGSSRTALWERFATLIGVAPDSVDASSAKSNASLTIAEVELLRRVNQALPADIPEWFYMHYVKGALAHEAFPAAPSGNERLELPAERDEWAREQAEQVIAELKSSGYDVIGDLAELLPVPPGGARPRPSDARSDDMLRAAVVAIVKILSDFAAARTRRQLPQPAPPATGVKRRLIAQSERHPLLRAARRGWSRVANALRHARTSHRDR